MTYQSQKQCYQLLITNLDKVFVTTPIQLFPGFVSNLPSPSFLIYKTPTTFSATLHQSRAREDL